MKGILIVGGSVEAHELAWALPGARVWLPGPERLARRWPGAVAGGALRDALEGVRCVVEAAHPCDAATAFAVARAAEGLPRLQLVRPGWRGGRGDRWVRLRDLRAARRVIPEGARVLVTLGRGALPRLRGLRARLLVRRLVEAAEPWSVPGGRVLAGVGPFPVDAEMRLMRKERVDWLLLHDAGGAGAWPKLAAARRLGLRVALVDRPRRPGGPRVHSVDAALHWLRQRGHV